MERNDPNLDMKKLLIIGSMIVAGVMFAANPSFQTFNTNFFQLNGTGVGSIRIKTNAFTWGSLGGGGGDTVWTNSNGVIQPLSGQTTNTLKFTSGMSSATTNRGVIFDTATHWDAWDAKLLEVRNSGAGVFNVFPTGGIAIGSNTVNWVSNPSGISIVRDPDFEFPLSGLPAVAFDLGLYQDSSGDDWTYELSIRTNSALIGIHYPSGYLWKINPTVAPNGSAVAYTYDTWQSMGTGDKIIAFRNNGTNKVWITGAGETFVNSLTLPISVATSASTNHIINFGGDPVKTITLTNDFRANFTTNRTATGFAKSVTYRIAAGGSSRNLSWNTDWTVFSSSGMPASSDANKALMVTFLCRGPNETDVDVTYVNQAP